MDEKKNIDKFVKLSQMDRKYYLQGIILENKLERVCKGK